MYCIRSVHLSISRDISSLVDEMYFFIWLIRKVKFLREQKVMETVKNSNSIEYVEVWEDIVSVKDLVLSLLICAVATLGAYFIAPNHSSMPLFFGLFGALIGFIICSVLFKPKRNFIKAEEGK